MNINNRAIGANLLFLIYKNVDENNLEIIPLVVDSV
jgi:hypothetical protein